MDRTVDRRGSDAVVPCQPAANGPYIVLAFVTATSVAKEHEWYRLTVGCPHRLPEGPRNRPAFNDTREITLDMLTHVRSVGRDDR